MGIDSIQNVKNGVIKGLNRIGARSQSAYYSIFKHDKTKYDEFLKSGWDYKVCSHTYVGAGIVLGAIVLAASAIKSIVNKTKEIEHRKINYI